MANDTTTVDLTDVAVNPDAAPQSTPRQGGFTLRNRWNCSRIPSAATFAANDIAAVKSTAATTFTATPFFVLDVPKRTLVKDICVFAIPGQTSPDHALTYGGTSASLSANDIKSMTLKWYAVAWKKNNMTSAATYVDAFGEFDLTATTASLPKGSIAGNFLAPAYSASSNSKTSTPTNAGLMMGNAMTNGAWGAGTYKNPQFFPHGGRIALRIGGMATSISSSTSGGDTKLKLFSGALSGVWDVQANCNYVPE
jgi:hypothetical protein